jgi:cytochrome P450
MASDKSTMPLSEFQSASFIANPYPLYAHLRASNPVAWFSPMGSWLVSRYHDVKELFHDKRLVIRVRPV